MEFTLKYTFTASAQQIYEAWLDSEMHTQMTGGEASINDQVGDHFSAWDGYIEGTNLELEPGKKIIQSWRTSEFGDHEADSRIEILFDEKDGLTEITLLHSNLPAHGKQYMSGWDNHYFRPMAAYFNK